MRGQLKSHLALVVGVFAAVGVGLALTAYVSMGWARVQFVTDAAGTSPETFGPVFVAAVAVQTTVTAFLVGPVLAGLLGFLVGSRYTVGSTAAVVTGGGSLLGFYVLALCAVGGVVAGLSGAGTEQVYGVGQVLGTLLVAGVPTLVVGAAGGVLGSATN